MLFFLGFILGVIFTILCFAFDKFPISRQFWKRDRKQKIYSFKTRMANTLRAPQSTYYITNLSKFYSAYATIADFRFTLISENEIFDVISDNGAENGTGKFFKANSSLEELLDQGNALDAPLNKFFRAYRLGIIETLSLETLLTHKSEKIRNWAKEQRGKYANV